MDYDVIYIGSGNASWQGARFLRKAGLKILIIEKSLYGGACANRGCNSKALLDAPYEIKALADNFEGCGKSGASVPVRTIELLIWRIRLMN